LPDSPLIEIFRMVFPETDPMSSVAFAEMMRPLYDFEIPDFASGLAFFSSSDIHSLPDVTVSRTNSSAIRLTRTMKLIARSAADQIMVICYRSGPYRFETGGIKRRVEPGDFSFFDLSKEIMIEAPAVDNVGLAISRRKLETLFPDLGHVHGLVIAPSSLTRVLLSMMEETLATGSVMTLSEASSIADAMLQLVVACLDLPPRQPVGIAPPSIGTGIGTASLAAVRASIERRLTDRTLGPQTLLDEFGITRSTLYRLFEPLGGVSAYITERRLRYAFHRITNPLEPASRISQLAFDLGFSHPSTFTRAFKSFFGLSPKDARASAVHPKLQEPMLLEPPETGPYLQPNDKVT